jgi:hypothetical protein
MISSFASVLCAILLHMELSVSRVGRRCRSYSYKARDQHQGEEGDACDKTFSFHFRFLSDTSFGYTFTWGAIEIQAIVAPARTPLWDSPQ